MRLPAAWLIPAWLFAALLLPCQAAALDFRVMYLDQEVPPYIMGTGEVIPEPPGMVVELVRRVAAELDVKLRLDRKPTRRTLEALRFGDADALIGRVFTPDRPQDLVYPMRGNDADSERRLARLSYRLYRLQGSAMEWDGQRIFAGGALPQIGMNPSAVVRRLLNGMGVEPVEVNSSRQLFSMLEARRVHGAAMLENVAETAGRMPLEKLDPPLATFDFYMPVTPAFYASQKEFCELFWQRLGERRDVTYAELLPAYLN